MMGWTRDKGSGSLLPGGGWRGWERDKGVVVSRLGGVHMGWTRDKGSGSLSPGGGGGVHMR